VLSSASTGIEVATLVAFNEETAQLYGQLLGDSGSV